MSGTPDIDGYHPPRRGPVRVDPTPRGLGLLRRLLLYHLTLGVVAVVLVSVVPALTAQLPIGGVRILATLYVCRFGDGFESDYMAARKELKRRLKAREVPGPDPDAGPS